MPFLTPDEASGTVETCYLLRFPDTNEFRSLVDGALASLVFENSWREYGTMSPQDTAQVFKKMLLEAEHRCMIGMIMPFAGLEVPSWGLVCDGSQHPKEDYPRLYEKIHPAFRTPTFFTVPNLVDRTVIGAKTPENGSFDFLDVGGEISHTLTHEEMPNHDHGTLPHSHSDIGHSHYYNPPGITIAVVAPGEVPATAPNFLGGFTATGHAVLTDAIVDVTAAGGGESHNNMPPFMALRWVIVAR